MMTRYGKEGWECVSGGLGRGVFEWVWGCGM